MSGRQRAARKARLMAQHEGIYATPDQGVPVEAQGRADLGNRESHAGTKTNWYIT